ncbi:MAG TPA: hypothetical protein VMF70_05420 [Gemmatimonadales bacterium]|nr:hypothetical protein [Gemmatimonadales bacterium]
MRARGAVLALVVVGRLGIARDAFGQAAVASDLWQVAGATLVVPPPLVEDGSAALWMPAVVLDRSGSMLRIGVEAIHAPSDVGVSGGIAAVGIRLGALGTLNAVYGRLGVDGLVRTETSPEGIGGDVPVYAEVISLGFARSVAPGLVAGAAVRSMAGQLDVESRNQLGLDVGLRYTDPNRITLAFATRFFDPTFRQAEEAASYSVATSYRTLPSPMLGSSGVVTLRYGATWSHGEGVQHLLSAGLALARVLEVDVGAAREVEDGVSVWRSRLGFGVVAGRYRVYLARDGGVNDFGATYRFGLTTAWR